MNSRLKHAAIGFFVVFAGAQLIRPELEAFPEAGR